MTELERDIKADITRLSLAQAVEEPKMQSTAPPRGMQLARYPRSQALPHVNAGSLIDLSAVPIEAELRLRRSQAELGNELSISIARGIEANLTF